MTEKRVKFSINEKKYILLIEKKFMKSEIYLFKEEEGSQFLTPVPIEVSTSSFKEMATYWLIRLESKLKRIHRKHKKKRMLF